MKLANRASGFAGILLLLGTVHSVDIAGFSDQGCPLLDRDFYCPGQPERVCCEFGPTRLTATVSVEFVGLGEGDLATWFHGEDIGTVHNYCGGIRKSQVMMGNTPGALCMDIENDVLAESNDGANWRKGAEKNTKAKVLLASSKYGSVSSFLNGLKLVSPVGARGLPKDDSVETKCLATRHATIIGFDKRDNETGVWILTGNLESHERYANVKARHPTKSAAEILQLAGGTYHENWEDHPIARAVRRREPAPTHELPSLMEMINSGELEKNKYTLALAAVELSKKSIDASTDPPTDSFPWISQRDSEDHEDSPLNDKRQAATSDAEPVDSFPWISTRDVEKSEGGSSEKEREIIRSEDVDSLPWIVSRDGDELNGDSSVEKRHVDVSEEVDSFPWIN